MNIANREANGKGNGMKFSEWLRKRNACKEAQEWVGNKSFERAVSECKRPDWLAYLVGSMRVGPPTKLVYVFSDTVLDRMMQQYSDRYASGGWEADNDLPERERVWRCNWLRAQMKPYLPKRMRFK